MVIVVKAVLMIIRGESKRYNMKTYRFYYFKCSYTSEIYIKANTLEEAQDKSF